MEEHTALVFAELGRIIQLLDLLFQLFLAFGHAQIKRRLRSFLSEDKLLSMRDNLHNLVL